MNESGPKERGRGGKGGYRVGRKRSSFKRAGELATRVRCASSLREREWEGRERERDRENEYREVGRESRRWRRR